MRTAAPVAQKIDGAWDFGVALDFHTTDSRFAGHDKLGHPIFETSYTELGALVHRLKHDHDQDAAEGIINAAVRFLQPHRHKIDVVVGVPPSVPCRVQPVEVIARGIAADLHLNFCPTGLRCAREIPALKDIEDPSERARLLEGLYRVDHAAIRGRNVLLIDDVYRSGATLNAVAEALKREGSAASVRVLAITRTRVNR